MYTYMKKGLSHPPSIICRDVFKKAQIYNTRREHSFAERGTIRQISLKELLQAPQQNIFGGQ